MFALRLGAVEGMKAALYLRRMPGTDMPVGLWLVASIAIDAAFLALYALAGVAA